MAIEGNVSPNIEGGGVGVTDKVAGDNLVLSTAQDALGGTFCCLLHYLFNVIVFISFFQEAGQIHNWYIGGRDMPGHSNGLPIKLWDDLAHSI